MRYRAAAILLMLGLTAGCSSYQPTKNVWKGTKSLWYTYASPPASVDYEDKGHLSQSALRLSQSMFAVDQELTRLERVMLNADRPPTQEWVTNFVINFPWVNGIAGVKYDGTILGQEPPTPLKELDYIPLLYEDKKQRRTALRGDVQQTPLGPEVLLAAPLYESADFLGIVCVHFDMRTLVTQVQHAARLVILSPYGLLWPGEYDFAQTPLAGQDWVKVCQESSSGVCSNARGKFLYQVRYLGNLPLVFAVAENENFPKGNGSVEQGLNFFPKDRPKLPPPPQPERKEKKEKGIPVFGKPEEMVPDILPPEEETKPVAPEMEQTPARPRQPQRRVVRRVPQRRIPLEALDVPQRTPPKPVHVVPDLDLGRDVKVPTLSGGRPSPFGDAKPKTTENTGSEQKQESTGEKPKVEPKAAEPKVEPKAQEPKLLPGGRPNPFGS